MDMIRERYAYIDRYPERAEGRIKIKKIDRQKGAR